MGVDSIKNKVGNSLAFHEIFQETRTVEEMTEQECRDHLTTYRQWLTWLPNDVIYWGSKIGSTIRISERSGNTKDGNYVGFNIEIKEHKVEGFSREYDLVKRKYFLERMTSIIPASNIIDFAFISEKQEMSEE